MHRECDPNNPLGPALLEGVTEALRGFLQEQTEVVTRIGAVPLLELAKTFTAGGKRLRPAFGYWSYVASAGAPADADALFRAVASLDMLHVSALVHDDLIDDSDTRRGLPSAHRQLCTLHESLQGSGGSDEFGRSGAILLGDLLLVWSQELFERSGLPAEAVGRARGWLEAMRTEVTCGQFLDLSAAGGVAGATTHEEELEIARRVLEYKSASYSVRRPAQIGAALAGADDQLLAALGEFGSSLGAAFQLRDDVLGVYGDPGTTGKPSGDDLREGKRTILVLTALERANRAQRDFLTATLGDPELDDDDVAYACQVIEETGALAVVEALILEGSNDALAALERADMTKEGRTALTRLTDLSVQRDR